MPADAAGQAGFAAGRITPNSRGKLPQGDLFACGAAAFALPASRKYCQMLRGGLHHGPPRTFFAPRDML